MKSTADNPSRGSRQLQNTTVEGSSATSISSVDRTAGGVVFGDWDRSDLDSLVHANPITSSSSSATPLHCTITRRNGRTLRVSAKLIIPSSTIASTSASTVHDTELTTNDTSTADSKNAQPPKPTSWSALFASKQSPFASTSSSSSQPQLLPQRDAFRKRKLQELLSSFVPCYTMPSIQPRGLVNRGNMCFMNVTLQTLLFCRPLYNLLQSIATHMVHNFHSKTPLLDAMIMFTKEFILEKNVRDTEERYGEPLTPEYVYDALKADQRFNSAKGQQEDAEEFMGFILDCLHDEFLELMERGSSKSSSMDDSVDGDGWFEVGQKNRPVVTRSLEITESPVTKLFSGNIRSLLKVPRTKDSVNIEPFHSLQLDISPDHVTTIQAALYNMVKVETLDGYMSPSGPVQATKQLFLQDIPPILILHLKRFVFFAGDTHKLHKHIQYPSVLNLTPDLFSPAKRPPGGLSYQLISVVYHHGTSAVNGHYTCDVKCPNGEWLRVDDTVIVSVEEENVLEPKPDRSEYLLMYQRISK